MLGAWRFVVYGKLIGEGGGGGTMNSNHSIRGGGCISKMKEGGGGDSRFEAFLLPLVYFCFVTFNACGGGGGGKCEPQTRAQKVKGRAKRVAAVESYVLLRVIG